MAVDMIYYASIGKTNKVVGCLNDGTDVDAMNFKKETALFFAAKNGKYATMKILLKGGAKPNSATLDGMTPVIVAAINNHESCLRLLIQYGGTWCSTIDEDALHDVANDAMFDDFTDNAENKLQVSMSDIYLKRNSNMFTIEGIYKFTTCRFNDQKLTCKIVPKYGCDFCKELLKKESNTLRSLRHPNIIQSFYTSFSPNEDHVILLMEPISNCNLYQMNNISKLQINLEGKVDILGGIILACLYLQKRGILHNFLNSASVYITKEWNAKIGNMEFARHTFEQAEALPRTHWYYHLPNMAPEVVRNDETTHLSDVYSFGCLVWELFGRKRTWSWLREEDIISLSHVDHSISLPIKTCWPAFVQYIILICTQQKKERRVNFQNVFQIFQNRLCGADQSENIGGYDKNVVLNEHNYFSRSCATRNQLVNLKSKVTFNSVNETNTLDHSKKDKPEVIPLIVANSDTERVYVPIAQKSCLKTHFSPFLFDKALSQPLSKIETPTASCEQFSRECFKQNESERICREVKNVTTARQATTLEREDLKMNLIQNLEGYLSKLNKKEETKEVATKMIKETQSPNEAASKWDDVFNLCKNEKQMVLYEIFQKAGKRQRTNWAKTSQPLRNAEPRF